MILDRYFTDTLDDALRSTFNITSNLSGLNEGVVKNLADGYSITLEVPGCSADDVTVEMHGSLLKVSGKSRHGRSFETSYKLPKSCDDSRITAKVKDGLMEIMIPKMEVSKPKEIKVTS